MAKPTQKRGKPKDTGRRVKKKVSILNSEQAAYIDWKDANLLRRFMSDRAKIRATVDVIGGPGVIVAGCHEPTLSFMKEYGSIGVTPSR